MDSLESLDFSSFIIFFDDPWSLLVSFCQLFKLPLVVHCCDVICEWPLTNLCLVRQAEPPEEGGPVQLRAEGSQVQPEQEHQRAVHPVRQRQHPRHQPQVCGYIDNISWYFDNIYKYWISFISTGCGPGDPRWRRVWRRWAARTRATRWRVRQVLTRLVRFWTLLCRGHAGGEESDDHHWREHVRVHLLLQLFLIIILLHHLLLLHLRVIRRVQGEHQHRMKNATWYACYAMSLFFMWNLFQSSRLNIKFIIIIWRRPITRQRPYFEFLDLGKGTKIFVPFLCIWRCFSICYYKLPISE